MFSEILKVIPKLDQSGLNRMQNQLSGRFTRIAKTFGRGLKGALLGGGAFALASSLVDKLLNPLKETQEAIDKTLAGADALGTNARQFNTTAGKLAKLQALAGSKGLDPQELFVLLQKFQSSVAEAKANPNEPSVVKNFTGEDTASEFFSFIQSLQRLNKNDQVTAQAAVFGEKQILKMAEFLQTDFASQKKLLGGPSTQTLDAAVKKLGEQEDLQALLRARREQDDLVSKSQLITSAQVVSDDQKKRKTLTLENERIFNFEALQNISTQTDRVAKVVEQSLTILADIASKLGGLGDTVKKIPGSGLLRGLFGGKE